MPPTNRILLVNTMIGLTLRTKKVTATMIMAIIPLRVMGVLSIDEFGSYRYG